MRPTLYGLAERGSLGVELLGVGGLEGVAVQSPPHQRTAGGCCLAQTTHNHSKVVWGYVKGALQDNFMII